MSATPDRRARLTAGLLTGALTVLATGVWISPEPRRWGNGPTELEVKLATETARSNDLKRQLDAANTIARRPRPLLVDVVQAARAEDLSRQLDEAEAELAKPRPVPPNAEDLARIRDLHQRLDDTTAALKQPRPPVIDPTEKARADDLAEQNDRLEAELSRPRPTIEPPVHANLTKAQIVSSRNLWGLYTAQSPFSFAEVDLVQSSVARRANLVGYFQSWVDPFRSDAITSAWKRGQVPMLTWEPQPQVGIIRSDVADYSLSNIISGRYDDYIRSYARGIRDLQLPIVIRLAHEMNGNWYPWSELRGWDGSSINGNKRGEYAQMWRHVHDLFQAEGANDYTIWLWSPNRVNQIPSQPPPAEFFPGDDFVDWIGMSGYYRPGDSAPTFADTYGQTLPLLRATSSKPIFLAEIGATEIGHRKTTWETDLFEGLGANPDIIGFAWFNLTVTSGQGTNDWRINSTSGSTQTMREALAISGLGLPGE